LKLSHSTNEIKCIKNSVITIGMFDGVHLGHQKILALLNEVAKKNEQESLLLTFNPHPRFIFEPNADLKLLTTQEEKIKKLNKYGLDHLFIQSFSPDFFKLSALDFVRDFLIDKLKMKTLIIGHDHHFGRNREGNFENLKRWSKEYNFDLIQLPVVSNEGIAISSTKIRNALLGGDLPYAKLGLNEAYSIEGSVVTGNQIGRTIGFPTANIKVENLHKLIPANGVYGVRVLIEKCEFYGMCNIGNRPTIDGIEQRIEVNLFDFERDIYEKTIRIFFLIRVRDEKKFSSLEDLKNQIQLDKKEILLHLVK
jgi:riboflavin kinase / FMN adenylyltransferase